MTDLRSSEGREIRRLIDEQSNAVLKMLGLTISTALQDLLVTEFGLDLKEAKKISKKCEERLRDAEELRTEDGTVFRKV